MSSLTWAAGFSVLIAFVAYFFTINHRLPSLSTQYTEDDLLNVQNAWKASIVKPRKQFLKVSVGINACVDLIVDGIKLLEQMGIQPGERKQHTVVRSLSDLQEVFHYHFAQGAAAERFFSDGEQFKELTRQAADVNNASWYIGGNAALIAQTMAETFPEVKVHFSGPVGPKLQSLLHRAIELPSSSLTESDEIHLIMQFAANEVWGDSSTPIATRFITSHDLANSRMSSLENFIENIHRTSPDLVVFSGLHMLEGQPIELWEKRVDSTADSLRGISFQIPLHLELASMANSALVKAIVTKVLPTVDSFGLNEQELDFISKVMDYPHEGIFQEGSDQPVIHRVTTLLTWLMENQPLKNTRISRIHFHCLSFHIIVTTDNMWHNTQASVAAGARTASLQACAAPSLDAALARIQIPTTFRLVADQPELVFDSSKTIYQFKKSDLLFTFSPVLVCKHPQKTVGLGDAISASGLMYSEFNNMDS